MFIHIGNNIILNEKDMIAIYNIESIQDTEEYKKIIKDLKEKHNLKEESEINNKSLIITKESDRIIGYMTNISSITIAKRAQMNRKEKEKH